MRPCICWLGGVKIPHYRETWARRCCKTHRQRQPLNTLPVLDMQVASQFMHINQGKFHLHPPPQVESSSEWETVNGSGDEGEDAEGAQDADQLQDRPIEDAAKDEEGCTSKATPSVAG